jgi:hypothetical protein
MLNLGIDQHARQLTVYTLVDRRHRNPVRPLAFLSHDGRELGADDMELVPSKGFRPPRTR